MRKVNAFTYITRQIQTMSLHQVSLHSLLLRCSSSFRRTSVPPSSLSSIEEASFSEALASVSLPEIQVSQSGSRRADWPEDMLTCEVATQHRQTLRTSAVPPGASDQPRRLRPFWKKCLVDPCLDPTRRSSLTVGQVEQGSVVVQVEGQDGGAPSAPRPPRHRRSTWLQECCDSNKRLSKSMPDSLRPTLSKSHRSRLAPPQSAMEASEHIGNRRPGQSRASPNRLSEGAPGSAGEPSATCTKTHSRKRSIALGQCPGKLRMSVCEKQRRGSKASGGKEDTLKSSSTDLDVCLHV